MKFVTVDFVFLCLILICVVISTIRGFISELFGKASWIIGLIAAFILYDEFSPLFTGIANGFLRTLVAFVIIFVVVFMIFKLLEIIFLKFVENDILSSLNRALGFLLGCGEGLALVSLIVHFLNWQTWFEVKYLEGSFFAALLG